MASTIKNEVKAEKMKSNQTSKSSVIGFDNKREGSYKPRISPEHLRKLWLRKTQTGTPITELIAEALDFYFENEERG
jgi:hypothetical protein